MQQTNSQRLHEIMQTECSLLYETYHHFWRHPQVADLVVPFLVLMHQLIRASVPLMITARSVAREFPRSDVVAGDLERYLARHIREEQAHDEWLLEDFDAAGIGRHIVLEQTPSATVASLVGAQYYWSKHHHPVALLGYIRTLEGNPPSAAHVAHLKTVSSRPERLFRTYRLHGELDPTHLRDFDEMYDALPLSGAQADLVAMSSSHTAHLLAFCLRDLVSAAEQSGPAHMTTANPM